MTTKKRIPVFVLSGFLGSGKTTLLLRLLAQFKERALVPGVIMNEIGEVSLDGAVIQADVPMEEIMNGCICCTVRGELSLSIQAMVEQYKPDVIVIEATGLANPLELIEGVTDTSLVMWTELHSIITVVDTDHFFSRIEKRGAQGSSKTLLLLEDQIRAANVLILNKTDMLQEAELQQVIQQIRTWNSRAAVHLTTYSQITLEQLDHANGLKEAMGVVEGTSNNGFHAAPKSFHDHITVYTHYFNEPLNRKRFERFIATLPPEVYRGKGFLTFDEQFGVRTLFQYAYDQLSLMDLEPHRSLPDVIVLMGENISRSRMKLLVSQLTSKAPVISKSRSMAATNRTDY